MGMQKPEKAVLPPNETKRLGLCAGYAILE